LLLSATDNLTIFFTGNDDDCHEHQIISCRTNNDLLSGQEYLADQFAEPKIQSPENNAGDHRNDNDQGGKVCQFPPGKPDHFFQLIDDFANVVEKPEPSFLGDSLLRHYPALPSLSLVFPFILLPGEYDAPDSEGSIC
jgi:hypothetical protein